MAVMRGNRVGGNWLMKWDEVKKIPLYSHRLTHRKRMTSELHDSYFRSMTITQAIPKIAEVTHPDCQISEEIAEAWRRVHIIAWEFEGNIRPTNWTEGGQMSWVELEGETSCSKESQNSAEWTPGLRLSSHGERERHNADGHNFGVKIFSYVRSPAPSHTQTLSNPFRTLAIKWEVNIFLRSLPASFITASVYHRIGMYPVDIYIFLHESADDNIT